MRSLNLPHILTGEKNFNLPFFGWLIVIDLDFYFILNAIYILYLSVFKYKSVVLIADGTVPIQKTYAYLNSVKNVGRYNCTYLHNIYKFII